MYQDHVSTRTRRTLFDDELQTPWTPGSREAGSREVHLEVHLEVLEVQEVQVEVLYIVHITLYSVECSTTQRRQ